MSSFNNRINLEGNLESILINACSAYAIGALINFNVVEIGYEDFNVKIETDSGKYFIKIFSKYRSPDEIKRLISILEKINDRNLSPQIHEASSELLFRDSGLSMVLMDFVEGSTFANPESAPTDAELRSIVKKVAQIHNIEFSDLPFVLDSWAVQNRHALWDKTNKIIEPMPEYDFVKNAIAAFDRIPYYDLPMRFCHGDISKQNTMRRAEDGEFLFVDFSCANIYPRIHDLSVIATELMYNNGRPLLENAEVLLDTYSDFNPLTQTEVSCFTDYMRGAIATLFMNPIGKKYLEGDDSSQAEFFIQNAKDLMSQF